MSTLVALGLANAAIAALLAIPAYLVSRRGRRPALAHALWLLVLLKLLTPPLIRPDLPWLPAEPAEEAPAIATQDAPPTGVFTVEDQGAELALAASVPPATTAG